jgi:site-specific DNA-methyltransferase (adenine-specific)
MQRNKVYVGNNIDVLKTFPDNSVDSIVTDPPYGLGKEPDAVALLQDWITTGYHEVKGKGFMGKEWDAFVPQPIFWKECYRVLKHGGHVLSFAGTRTYDWVVIGLRLAGFEIRDQLAWIYGSGFPKSHDISKAIDKKFGAEREVVGSNPSYRKMQDNPSSYNLQRNENITTPSTDQAKEWQGWGTALKPALEPIVMARKPLDGTVADNVLKHGVGGINIDGCRVEFEDTPNPATNPKYRYNNDYKVPVGGQESNGSVSFTSGKNGINNSGRFPANVIHDGSDEVVALFPDTSPSVPRVVKDYEVKKDSVVNFVGSDRVGGGVFDNGGSASRFFYTAKASQTERNWGLDGFEENETLGGGGRAKNGYDDDNDEEQRLKLVAGKYGAVKAKKKNIHPTVKPIDLMRYLVRLVTPKGGVCLDPF